MKLLFSEAKPDYQHYIFPYVIWGFPETGETAADFFEAGFLPSSKTLDRFYLARQLRVNLARFALSSENRRVLRKGEAFEVRLMARAEFPYDAGQRAFCKQYADARLGKDVMSWERLDELFHSPLVTHVLVCRERASGKECGYAVLHLEAGRLGYYYFAYYDLELFARNLGMFLMTSAVCVCAEAGVPFLYLGTCYSRSALYKTQFAGVEFFNGHRWSEDLKELKFLLRRQEGALTRHLLEDPEYVAGFAAPPGELGAASSFRLSRIAENETGAAVKPRL